MDKKIGLNIRVFRKKLGLQANKLAEQLKISPSYLNLIESGKRNIDAELLLKICQELRIELSDLKSEKDIDLKNSKIAISKFSARKNFNKLDLKIGPKIKAFRRQLGLQGLDLVFELLVVLGQHGLVRPQLFVALLQHLNRGLQLVNFEAFRSGLFAVVRGFFSLGFQLYKKNTTFY